MEIVSKKIIGFIQRNEIISEQDKEIYLFGLILMLRISLNLLTLLVIGVCFNMLGESMIFAICSVMIRTYSGGFHADDPIVCHGISVTIIILMLLSIKFGLWNLPISFVLMISSIGIILRYAPVEHKNKPLEENEMRMYRKILFLIVFFWVLASVILLVTNSYYLLYSISFSFAVSAAMILIAKIKIYIH